MNEAVKAACYAQHIVLGSEDSEVKKASHIAFLTKRMCERASLKREGAIHQLIFSLFLCSQNVDV